MGYWHRENCNAYHYRRIPPRHSQRSGAPGRKSNRRQHAHPYGGSVKPENAEIDGALVGGASLDPKSFAAIVKAGVPA